MSVDGFNDKIIIKKIRDNFEEEHHGGVWKLAFADFMTAMMAFFLVMWLINSTSKETKAVIVQYFNPVQLVDSYPERRGLRDPKDKMQDSRGPVKEAVGPKKEQGNPQEISDDEIRSDPLRTLDKISAAAEKGDPKKEANGDQDELRDAFDEPVAQPLLSRMPKDAAPAGRVQSDSQTQIQKSKLKKEIEDLIKSERSVFANSLGVELADADGNITISLTDNDNVSMFSVGSIVPNRQAVKLLERIGKILAESPGDVEISGHTDARMFKSKTNENWRLSTERASVVTYMLARGGLPDSRIAKIAGFADRKLKAPQDPLGAINRRIEIVLRVKK